MRLRVESGLPNIQKRALERFSLSYPQDINGQQKIVEILSTADQEIEILQRNVGVFEVGKRDVDAEIVIKSLNMSKKSKEC